MRSTVRIDDDLMVALRRCSEDEGLTLTRMLNRLLRVGLATWARRSSKRQPYTEVPVRMGRPRVNIDKALALAAALEDEEIVRKISLRK